MPSRTPLLQLPIPPLGLSGDHSASRSHSEPTALWISDLDMSASDASCFLGGLDFCHQGEIYEIQPLRRPVKLTKISKRNFEGAPWLAQARLCDMGSPKERWGQLQVQVPGDTTRGTSMKHPVPFKLSAISQESCRSRREDVIKVIEATRARNEAAPENFR